MARDQRVTTILRPKGLLVEGSHFRYTNPEPRHGEVYLNCRPLIPHAHLMVPLVRDLIADIAVAMREVDPLVVINTVMGPAHGGDKIAQYLAAVECAKTHYLSEGSLVYIETAKTDDGDGFIVKPGRFYERQLNSGSRVLVVDDVFTSGSSVKKVIELVRSYGAEVVAVGGFVNRDSEITAKTFGVKAFAVLEEFVVPDYLQSDCPLCAEGRPMVTNVGHGKKFRDEHPGYKGSFVEMELPE